MLRACFCLLALFALGQGYTPCVKSKPADVSAKWFLEAAAMGFHLIEHSDCSNCENQEAWQWFEGKGRSIGLKNLCWMMHVMTKAGPYKLPFDCTYHDEKIASQECVLDFSKTNNPNKIPIRQGTIVLTHTDNANYVGGTVCIHDSKEPAGKQDKENFWFIMTTDPKKTIDKPGVLDSMITDFHKMGFKPNNTAVAGKSPLFVEKLSAHPSNC